MSLRTKKETYPFSSRHFVPRPESFAFRNVALRATTLIYYYTRRLTRSHDKHQGHVRRFEQQGQPAAHRNGKFN